MGLFIERGAVIEAHQFRHGKRVTPGVCLRDGCGVTGPHVHQRGLVGNERVDRVLDGDWIVRQYGEPGSYYLHWTREQFREKYQRLTRRPW